MDDFTARQLTRIEKKVDVLLSAVGGAILVAAIHWWAPELVKNYGISEGVSVAIAIVAATALFAFIQRGVDD
jgi:hypothetical protein